MPMGAARRKLPMRSPIIIAAPPRSTKPSSIWSSPEKGAFASTQSGRRMSAIIKRCVSWRQIPGCGAEIGESGNVEVDEAGFGVG